MTDAPKLLSREEKVARIHGHQREPDGDESQLAHRVLELPDTGSERWYTASAVTLAAAYLEARAHIAALEAERDAKRAEVDELLYLRAEDEALIRNLEAERDEARAEAQRMREALAKLIAAAIRSTLANANGGRDE